MPIAHFNGKGSIMEQHLVLIPCNQQGSLHWYLMVVYPKESTMLILDSVADKRKANMGELFFF